jgi:hypothetical protein
VEFILREIRGEGVGLDLLANLDNLFANSVLISDGPVASILGTSLPTDFDGGAFGRGGGVF